MDEILDQLLQEGDRHLTSGPASEAELDKLETIVGQLPPAFRMFLTRVGAGLFYQGHEIFGPQRVMVHDIELVPSLGAMHARLRNECQTNGLIPFHRFEGLVHCFDSGDSQAPGRIVSLPAGTAYPDLATFLRTIVLA